MPQFIKTSQHRIPVEMIRFAYEAGDPNKTLIVAIQGTSRVRDADAPDRVHPTKPTKVDAAGKTVPNLIPNYIDVPTEALFTGADADHVRACLDSLEIKVEAPTPVQ